MKGSVRRFRAGRTVPIVLSPRYRIGSIVTSQSDTYRDVVQGKTNLVVEIRVRYRGPRGNQHCYLTRDNYDYIDRVFYTRGGSLSCAVRMIVPPE
jgi:hypothetical protein